MNIKLRMAVWCAAAGRQYNEDNYLLKDNLSETECGMIKTDEILSLDEKGALLVVCDGMGGMNAGEVASSLAIQAIQEQFATENLTPKIMANNQTILNFVENAIIAADKKIKEDGKQNKEHEGMGSTIVLAWIVGKNMYVGWCGDSRAYRFNPEIGLEQLSCDHSYVQELVDAGKLSPELAFDHPDSNIITRSLGDSRQKARPDVKFFPLYNDDIILLCSDGLSGVLRDEEMQDIICNHTDSMENCRKALWEESEKVGWTDNVTIALCQIVSGANAAPKGKENKNDKPQKKKKNILLVVIVLILGIGIVYFCKKEDQEEYTPFETSPQGADTLTNDGKTMNSTECVPNTSKTEELKQNANQEKTTNTHVSNSSVTGKDNSDLTPIKIEVPSDTLIIETGRSKKEEVKAPQDTLSQAEKNELERSLFKKID